MQLSAARVFVADLARAKQFYLAHLALPIEADGLSQGYYVFDARAVDLFVKIVKPDDPYEDRDLEGRFNGLSFAVPDITAAFQRLFSLRVRFTGPLERQIWGGWLATFQDSDGNGLQLVQHGS